MDIVLAAVVAAAVAAIVVVAGQRRGPATAAAGAPRAIPSEDQGRDAGDATVTKATAVEHAPSPARGRTEAVAANPDESVIELELRERRAEIARTQERLITKEEALDLKLA